MKYKAIRWDEPSSEAPGAVYVGIQGGESDDALTAVWPVCADQTPGHKHSKACAQVLLNAVVIHPDSGAYCKDSLARPAVMSDDEPPVELEPAVPDSRITPKAWFAKWSADRAAKEQAKEAVKAAVEPMPQKTVVKKVDGKNKSVQVDDPDLT